MPRALSSVLVGLIAVAACPLGFQVYALLAYDTVIWTGPLIMGPAGWIYGLLTSGIGFVLLTRRPDLSWRVTGVGLCYLLLLLGVCLALSSVLEEGVAMFALRFIVSTLPLGLAAAPVFMSEGGLALPALITGLASVAPLWLALGMLLLSGQGDRDGASQSLRPAPARLGGSSRFILAALVLVLAVPLAFYLWVARVRPAHPVRGEVGRTRVLTSCAHPEKPIWVLVPTTASALLEALETGDEELRASAAYALGQLRVEGKTAERIVVALGIAAGDMSAHVREHAVMAMGRLDHPRAVGSLIGALRDEEAPVRRFAADALAFQRPVAAIPALKAALQDEDAGVRERAGRALASLEEDSARKLALEQKRRAAESAVPALVEALHDPDESIRRKALEGLKDAGPAGEPAVATLIEMLRSEGVRCAREPGVRLVLGGIGPAAVPALIEALRDQDACVRAGAAEVLELIGPSARAATPALEHVASADQNALVRMLASQALKRVR